MSVASGTNFSGYGKPPLLHRDEEHEQALRERRRLVQLILPISTVFAFAFSNLVRVAEHVEMLEELARQVLATEDHLSRSGSSVRDPKTHSNVDRVARRQQAARRVDAQHTRVRRVHLGPVRKFLSAQNLSKTL